MPGPLQQLVMSLGLAEPRAWAPDPTFVGPIQPPPTPAPLTGWRGAVDTGLNALVGGVKGLTGFGDQGPAGPTVINAAAIIGGVAGGPVKALAAKLPRFAKAIKAFHGSPHDFPAEVGAPLGRFKSSAIGTGEGAQAYGHGLYFAENEATARSYRDALTPIRREDLTEMVAALPRAYRGNTDNAERIIADMQRALAQGDITHPREYVQAFEVHPSLLPAYEKAAVVLGTGKMYEVGIKADPKHLLDWDQPLDQQSAFVRKALKRAGIDEADVHPPAGSRAYAKAYDLAGSDQAAASARLRQAGIPGIKYLDQGSRQAGEGSRNFVIFDDHTIDILKKYGVLLPTAGLGAVGAHEAQK